MLIREAHADELAEVGNIRVAAYLAGGFLAPDSGYLPTLRTLGCDGDGHVMVALRGGPGGPVSGCDQIAGTVMLQPWPQAGRMVTGPDEAEIRALAVAPDAQGSGVGTALLRAVIERAAGQGIAHLVLCTQPEMTTAQRSYARAGFIRLADRDWSPVPGVDLLAYGLRLVPAATPAG
jgi:ribosomal protein S18 acetylase RimI-like enzyme